jgi:O-antigen ligase
LKSDHPTLDEEKQQRRTAAAQPVFVPAARAAEHLALAGFALYSIFAPHSIAGAEIALGPVGIGLLWRLLVTRRTGLRRSPLDLPILLFIVWTVLSSLLSTEPHISIPKLQAVAVILMFYLARAFITRRTAVFLVALMITSGVAGVAWSMIDLARGRGVLIEELSSDSPFQEFQIGAGDAVWRVNGARISSVQEIDEAIKRTATGARLPVSIIVKGEHGERPGFVVTDEMKARPSPSGIKSTGPTHRFRASGWTRHYETFSETLQILAQLSLGLALAHLGRGSSRRIIIALAFAATALLTIGIVLTAMRTALVAFAIGATIIALRSTRGRARLIVAMTIALLLLLGALAVWHTRPSGALVFEDDSSTLRLRVARVGVSRIMVHPFFGHGMDAVQNHWTEWGFPGTDMIHLHSTPLQLAFDRGLPALLFWLWIMAAGWMTAARAEKLFRDFTDANCHGLLLGATGAIAGFFASSLVNYNFGDAEVILVFWWLMGIVVSVMQNAKLKM